MGTAAGSSGRRNLVLAAMTVANAMVLVDQTAVPLTLPAIMRHFDVGSQLAQWVLNGSLLSLAGVLVLGGQLGDIFGRRRVFVVGTVVFALASACAGLAPDFALLLVFRFVQGAAGALMLPTTVAIVSATFTGRGQGGALGTMGGIAAVAGAAGPVVGGVLTSTVGWQAVFLINVPLAAVAALVALFAVAPDSSRHQSTRVDLIGAALLAVAIVTLIIGLGQAQSWGWTSVGVWAALALAVVAAVVFVVVERRRRYPLVDFTLLGSSPNYRTAVISQTLGGFAEMGLGVILPLLLILSLQMSPGLAGLALLPASVPLIFIAPLVGRWYDRAGSRPPMATGYGLLAVSGVLLAVGGFQYNYWWVLPGLLLYGAGLAVVLTVNDPVSLSDVTESEQGQAAGVSATAEQFGGALGIAVLYLVFHTVYVAQLDRLISAGGLPDLDTAEGTKLRAEFFAAETTGLRVQDFDPDLRIYLETARLAAAWGYTAAFLGITLIGVAGLVLVWRSSRARSASSARPSA